MVCVLRDREDYNWKGSCTALLLPLWISQWQGLHKLIELTFLKCKVSISRDYEVRTATERVTMQNTCNGAKYFILMFKYVQVICVRAHRNSLPWS